MTTSVTRSCFTKQHQICKTKTKIKTAVYKPKTKTDFFISQTGLVLRPTVSDHITGTNGDPPQGGRAIVSCISKSYKVITTDTD